MNVEAILKDILLKEGGFVDHPEDHGGPTARGITMDTLSDWRGKPVTAEDMKLLAEDEALAIYRDRYVVQPGFAELPDPLRGLVVDSAVNHGVSRVTHWIQRALGVPEDGIMGGETRDAIVSADPKELYRKVLASRVRSYGRLVTDNPRQAVFAAGWLSRAASFIETCP